MNITRQIEVTDELVAEIKRVTELDTHINKYILERHGIAVLGRRKFLDMNTMKPIHLDQEVRHG